MPRLGREISAGIEGLLLGREERIQRPTPVSGHRLAGLHTHRVYVRALLAVDLDSDEALVHDIGDLGVLEGLMRHYVAPVAGGVTDRDEQRAVLLARAREGLLAPGVPVDRIVLVLEEVRRGLSGQAVGHLPNASDHHIRAV